MRYNPDTDRAKNLDELAEETRKVIQKLNPPKPSNVVWSPELRRYIPNPELAAV